MRKAGRAVADAKPPRRDGLAGEPDMTAAPSILIADDHPLFRLALGEAARTAAPGASIAQAATLDEMMDRLAQNPADLVLLDLMMPGANGFSGLLCLRVERPEIPVAIVSGVDDPRVIRKALEFGASGYIVKSAPPRAIADAIAAVLAGGTHWPPDALGPAADPSDIDFGRRLATLSSQQFKVLRLIAEGKLNKEIAHELDLSLSTVKAHMTAVLKKLGLQRRTQVLAAMQALDLEYIPRSDGL